ncbi:MAG: hypothetical protein OHK0017_08050 [Patescibacteria group bacterium]
MFRDLTNHKKRSTSYRRIKKFTENNPEWVDEFYSKLGFMNDSNKKGIEAILALRDLAHPDKKKLHYGSLYQAWQETRAAEAKGAIELSEHRIMNLVKDGAIDGEIKSQIINGRKVTEASICIEHAVFCAFWFAGVEESVKKGYVKKDKDGKWQYFKAPKNVSQFQIFSRVFLKQLAIILDQIPPENRDKALKLIMDNKDIPIE